MVKEDKKEYFSWYVVPVLLFSILNFGNYSFLRYSYDSSAMPSYINNLKYFRMVLPIFMLVYFFGLKKYIISFFYKVFFTNFDILALVLVVILHSLGNIDVIYPLWFITSLFSIFILFYILRLSSKDVNDYLKKVVFFIFLSAAIAIPFTFLSFPRLFLQNDIFFSSKSSFAYYNLILITSTLAYLILKNKSINLKFTLFIGLNILVILLSGRRTPLITSLACIIIYFIFFSFNIKSLIFITIISVLVSINFSFFSDNFLSVQRLQKIDTEDEYLDSSYEARIELRDYYFRKIDESNYFGLGFKEINNLTSDNLSTHNTYLTVFLILGFFGVFFYILMFLISLIKIILIANKKIVLSYLILFIPLLTINWVETNFMPGQIFYIYTMSVILFPRFINI